MYCHYCGYALEEDAMFCPECGQKVVPDNDAGGIVYQLSEEHFIRFPDNFLKYSQIRKPFENLAATYVSEIKPDYINTFKNDFAKTFDHIFNTALPKMGETVSALIDTALSVLQENNIPDISENDLWMFLLQKRDVFTALHAPICLFEDYAIYCQKHYKLPYESRIEKFSFYRELFRKQKEEKYAELFTCSSKILNQLDASVAALNGGNKDLCVAGKKAVFQKFVGDFNKKREENNGKSDKLTNSWSYKDCQLTLSMPDSGKIIPLLYDLPNVVNYFKDGTFLYVYKKLREKNLIPDSYTVFKKHESDTKYDETCRFMLEKRITKASDMISAYLRCIELYPYNSEIYHLVLQAEPTFHKVLLQLAEDVGITGFLLAVIPDLPKWKDAAASQDAEEKKDLHDGEEEFKKGESYFHGYGVHRNYETAAEWYRKAAEAGNIKAMKSLAHCYFNSLGVPKDYEEGAKWYRKAADIGDIEAIKKLVFEYYLSDNIPNPKFPAFMKNKDYEASLPLLLKYVDICEEKSIKDSDLPITLFIIGNLYHNGLGVETNSVESVKWYRKAADAGYSEAKEWVGRTLNELGVMYYNGEEVKQDLVKSVAFFKESAESGYIKGMKNLASSYRDGEGTPKDIEKAKYWYEKAASLGDEEAKDELKKLNKGEDSSDDGCFITTAVCSSLNKPDDCDELMTMRWYRDKLKAEDPDMAALISEYYRTAPLVVKKIDNDSDASLVYRQLWEDSISKIYHSLKKKEYRDATIRYVDMFERLCKKYDTPLACGIQDKIKAIRQRN